MFQSLDFFFVCCLFLRVESRTGQILPPQNVSLLWSLEFCPQLSWEAPPHAMENCTYEVVSQNRYFKSVTGKVNDTLYWKDFTVMDGGFLSLSVQTLCGDMQSERVFKNVSYGDLVTDLECFSHSSTLISCTWLNAKPIQDLRFFYMRVESSTPSCTVQECSSYKHRGGVRNGCDLQAKPSQTIHMLLNGTLDKKTVRNTFTKTNHKMRPPPLEWNITKTKDRFILKWNDPDIKILDGWKFVINYTECDKLKNKNTIDPSAELPIDPYCSYRIAVRAEAKNVEMPWGEEKYFDAEKDPNALVYAAVIIPLTFAFLAVLGFVFCRKNKEIIFPIIPKPRDLLSEISDKNNKSTVYNLCSPAEEEENCKITLVMDPQTDKVYS